MELAHGFRDRVGVLGLIGKDDHEFVAAQAHDGVGRADALAHPFGDGFQQFVAGVVAEAVVDEFEIVEIDEQPPSPSDRIVERRRKAWDKTVVEQGAVGKSGQRIMVGHELNAIFGELAFDGDAGDMGGDIEEAHFDRRGSRASFA